MLNSPELFPTCQQLSSQPALDTAYLHSLQQVEVTITTAATQPRLGLYAETLLTRWIEAHPTLELLAHNQQVFTAERQTRGAFDFLVQDRLNHIWWHWELTVKFYLLHQQKNETQWIGPDRRDTLQRKYTHLLERQIRLSDTPEGQQLLHQWHRGDWQKGILNRGYLFYPRDSWQTSLGPPQPVLNPAHNRGWWLHACQRESLNTPDKETASHWLIRHKPHWLLPVNGRLSKPPLDHHNLQHALAQHFAHSSRAIMLSELKTQDGVHYTEVSRGIVVPDCWPEASPA